MMKTTSKFLLAGAFAALVVAISAAPSEAGRAKKAAAATPACQPLTYCASNCANGWCTAYQCGFDGKYYQTFPPVCAQPFCINVQKKC